VWHRLDPDAPLPAPGTDVQGLLDWERRHLLMRTHTALHVLCGVIYADHGVAVTGGNMQPGEGRLDFPLEAMSVELGAWAQRRVNDEIARAREVLVAFVPRRQAAADPALIRTKADLIPAAVDPLRVIDIVGLDKQADGGTHVASTAEVGHVAVVKTESKGKANKRIRIAVGQVPPP
nr:alanyl-tRNA editing protein [Euzebyales bacterium]